MGHLEQAVIASLSEKTEESIQAYQGRLADTLQEFEGKTTKLATAARVAVDEAEGKMGDLGREALASVSARTEASIHAYQGRLADTLQEFQGKATQVAAAAGSGLDDAARRIAAEHVQRLQQLSTIALGEFQQQAAAALDSTQAELRHSIQQIQASDVEEIRGHLRQSTEEALESSRRELQDSTRDSLVTLREEIQASGTALRGDIEKQVTQVMQRALAHLARETEESAQAYQDRLREAVQEFQLSTMQLTASADVTLNEAERRMGQLGEAALASLSGKTAEAEKSGEQIAAAAKAILADTEKQLAELASAPRERLAAETQSLLAQSLAQFRTLIQYVHEEKARQLEAALQTALEKTQGDIRHILATETEKSAQSAIARISSVSEQAAQSFSAQVYQQIGKGVLAINDWTSQTQARLDASLQPSLESFRHQLTEISAAETAKHRKEVEGLVVNLHDALEQAARVFLAKKES
jgi:DNA polymerase III alpha subunit (gram-positive type)